MYMIKTQGGVNALELLFRLVVLLSLSPSQNIRSSHSSSELKQCVCCRFKADMTDMS